LGSVEFGWVRLGSGGFGSVDLVLVRELAVLLFELIGWVRLGSVEFGWVRLGSGGFGSVGSVLVRELAVLLFELIGWVRLGSVEFGCLIIDDSDAKIKIMAQMMIDLEIKNNTPRNKNFIFIKYIVIYFYQYKH
jgi:hypothetical protein